MFHPQQQPLFSYYSHQTHTNPNSNAYSPFPQQIVASAESALCPPGTEPSLYPLTHVGFEALSRYYDDPNAASQSWLGGQVDPIRYDAASIVSTSCNSLGPSNWTNQPLANDVTTSKAKKSKVVQSMQCEVCKIECNSKDVYEKHVLGKKHQKNLQIKNNPTSATFLTTSNTTNNISLPGQMIGISGGHELEIKRQKVLSSGAASDSVRVCTICDVACNSQEVFSKHLAGKKHAAQVGLVAVTGIKPSVAAVRRKKTKFVQSAWCEVCKINCNSNDVYTKHLLGKKHQKNLEQTEKSKNGTDAPAASIPAAATNAIIGPIENPEANKRKRAAKSVASEEVLETKKQKVMEGGAAAGAGKVCTLCNVVCNSLTVFNSHLIGQKHAAMVKKQAEARTAIADPQTVVATYK